MRSAWAILLGGAALVVALVGAIAWRSSNTAGASRPTPPPTEDERRRLRAHDALQAIAQASHDQMPPGFGMLYLAMPQSELLRLRPRSRPGRGSAPGAELYEETTDDGARVVYFVGAAGVLTKVQFLSRLANVGELMPHFTALRQRYGDPTGFWDCPETESSSPIRRITWRGRDVGVMEAILVYSGGVSVTLVIAPNADVAQALARSHCRPVTQQSLPEWPVARELRGERTPMAPSTP